MVSCVLLGFVSNCWFCFVVLGLVYTVCPEKKILGEFLSALNVNFRANDLGTNTVSIHWHPVHHD